MFGGHRGEKKEMKQERNKYRNRMGERRKQETNRNK
jgi:hypothetical protein